MAGLYIHVPFCKQKCTYCDFYTRVAPRFIPDFVDAASKEIRLRANYLKKEPIETIYFGGGTPSLLNSTQFQTIFDTIYDVFEILEGAEITFEANPDDLTDSFFQSLSPLPFNRISIGIQSFDADELKTINRRHSSVQAIDAVKRAKKYGFSNISIDLIYGLPGQSYELWKNNLEIALGMDVQHISIYGLTYEQGTVLWKQREQGKVAVVDDETMIQMYDEVLDKVRSNGFETYEISNFAKPGFRSRHNSAYWKMKPYLGIGPSAHSFDGDSRQWNISSIQKYIEAIHGGTDFYEKEILSENERYNEYVMVSLRTSDGIDLAFMKNQYPGFYEICLEEAQKFIDSGSMRIKGNQLQLTDAGIRISNFIISELMFVN